MSILVFEETDVIQILFEKVFNPLNITEFAFWVRQTLVFIDLFWNNVGLAFGLGPAKTIRQKI